MSAMDKRITPRSPRAALEPEHVPLPTRRSKRARNPLVIIGNAIFTLLILAVIATGTVMVFGKVRFEAPGPLEKEKVVIVPPRAGLVEIADLLQREGVIDEHRLVFIGGVFALKARTELKSGEYLFPKRASVRDVVEALVEGKVIQHLVTIPEGWTSEQITARLLDSQVLIGSIKVIPREGSMLPNSYNFRRGDSREQAIQRMQQAQQQLVKDVWDRRSRDLPLRTPEQLIILASIIEKETGRPEERSRIAAVFVNRLKQKMRLQTDPTVIYGLAPGKGTLGRPLSRADPGSADALQHLHYRCAAAGPDRQSGSRFARSRRQSGAHQGALLRVRRHRRAHIRGNLRAAPAQRRAAARGRTGRHPRTGARSAASSGTEGDTEVAPQYEEQAIGVPATSALPRSCDTWEPSLRSRPDESVIRILFDRCPMALSSMTGFARGQGVSGAYAWSWEIKSVNAKGLDLRLRLPSGWDAVEVPVRSRTSEVLARGTVYGTLTAKREGTTPVVKINEPVLAAVIAAVNGLSGRVAAEPPRLDRTLSLKGVIEVVDDVEREDERRAAEAAVVAGFNETVTELAAMRQREGGMLGQILSQRLSEIATLAARADAAPGRRPEAIKARILEQVETLLSTSTRFDPDRLHQEAILIASKSDIREELDRLASHVAQAQRLISDGGAIGRRLDFLAQELNREANTLCAKSNDVELTNIGLELKAVVEQFREQVQNLE